MLPEVNVYEQERRDRIARNQQVLQELGLLQHPISGAAEAQQREAEQRRAQAAKRQRHEERQQAGEAAAPLEPERRSRRLQGGAVENAGMELGSRLDDRQRPRCSMSSSSAWQPVQIDLEALESDGGDPSVDAHNVMRVRSMSERALQTRIWKIRRVDKLHSFVKVLEACGKAELADEAREALQQMCGGAAPALPPPPAPA